MLVNQPLQATVKTNLGQWTIKTALPPATTGIDVARIYQRSRALFGPLALHHVIRAARDGSSGTDGTPPSGAGGDSRRISRHERAAPRKGTSTQARGRSHPAGAGQVALLTAEQVRRLRGWAMLNYTRSTLKRLEQAGYIQRFRLRNPLINGSAPLVAALSTQGWQVVEQLGEDIVGTYQARRERGASHLFLPHTLAINDVLIAAMTLPGARSWRSMRASRMRMLDMLRRGPRTVTVIPDAWLELGYGGYAYPLALELDRGTEEQRRWRQKVGGAPRLGDPKGLSDGSSNGTN